MGSCAPLVTAQYKVLNCLKQTVANYNICDTKTIVPAFTTSTQTPVVSTVAITTAPALGTVVINTTNGVITYTATNPSASGTDTFTYTFCGNDPDFPDCESVTVTINIQPVTVTNTTLNACNVNGVGIFDLTTANITTNNPVTKTYYTSLLAAQTENATGQILVPNTYSAPNGTIVYVVVKNPTGCKNIAQITLNLFPLAVVTPGNLVINVTKTLTEL